MSTALLALVWLAVGCALASWICALLIILGCTGLVFNLFSGLVFKLFRPPLKIGRNFVFGCILVFSFLFS